MQEKLVRKPRAMKITEQKARNKDSIGKRKENAKKGTGIRKGEKQARIKPMRVMKAARDTATSKQDGKQPVSKKKPTVREHSILPSAYNGATNDVINDDCNLDEALKRRINWTPPRDTVLAVDLSVTPLTSPINRGDGLEEPTVDGRPGKNFKDLMIRFRYEGGERSSLTAVPMGQLEDSGTRKRQRAEVCAFILLSYVKLTAVGSLSIHL
jgi:hypothetical protein